MEEHSRESPGRCLITVFKRKPTEEELWMGVPPDFDGNRPSGNNLIDLFAYLIRKYGRMDTSEYARIMQLKTSELRGAILAIGGIIMVSRTNLAMSWIIILAVAVIFVLIMVLMRVALPKFQIMQTLIDRVNLVSREIPHGACPSSARSTASPTRRSASTRLPPSS